MTGDSIQASSLPFRLATRVHALQLDPADPYCGAQKQSGAMLTGNIYGLLTRRVVSIFRFKVWTKITQYATSDLFSLTECLCIQTVTLLPRVVVADAVETI